MCGISAAFAQTIPVVLDTDIGLLDVDDALALDLALGSPELDIRAIITRGRRPSDLVWKVLELTGRTEIPVGAGSEVSLVPGTRAAKRPIMSSVLAESSRAPAEGVRNGVRLLIDSVMQGSGETTIVAYGPLTNLALALRVEPGITGKLRRIVMMNGAFFLNRRESNTAFDAEAASIVYASGVPITAVGLDVTLNCLLEEADLPRFSGSRAPRLRLLDQQIRIWQQDRQRRQPILHDPLAVAVAIQPDLVKTVRGRVAVETCGKTHYGWTSFTEDSKGSVDVAKEVDVQRFLRFFRDRVFRDR